MDGIKMKDAISAEYEPRQKNQQYKGRSMIYLGDDSVLLLDSRTNRETWAYREYDHKNGRYTGRFRLQEDNTLIEESGLPPKREELENILDSN